MSPSRTPSGGAVVQPLAVRAMRTIRVVGATPRARSATSSSGASSAGGGDDVREEAGDGTRERPLRRCCCANPAAVCRHVNLSCRRSVKTATPASSSWSRQIPGDVRLQLDRRRDSAARDRHRDDDRAGTVVRLEVPGGLVRRAAAGTAGASRSRSRMSRVSSISSGPGGRRRPRAGEGRRRLRREELRHRQCGRARVAIAPGGARASRNWPSGSASPRADNSAIVHPTTPASGT